LINGQFYRPCRQEAHRTTAAFLLKIKNNVWFCGRWFFRKTAEQSSDIALNFTLEGWFDSHTVNFTADIRTRLCGLSILLFRWREIILELLDYPEGIFAGRRVAAGPYDGFALFIIKT
jgi:hypothetical protein